LNWGKKGGGGGGGVLLSGKSGAQTMCLRQGNDNVSTVVEKKVRKQGGKPQSRLEKKTTAMKEPQVVRHIFQAKAFWRHPLIEEPKGANAKLGEEKKFERGNSEAGKQKKNNQNSSGVFGRLRRSEEANFARKKRNPIAAKTAQKRLLISLTASFQVNLVQRSKNKLRQEKTGHERPNKRKS